MILWSGTNLGFELGWTGLGLGLGGLGTGLDNIFIAVNIEELSTGTP